MTLAAVELGGTKVLVTTGCGPGDHGPVTRLSTRGVDATLQATVRALETACPPQGFEAIGVASFGPLELDAAAPGYGRLLKTPKPGWSGADVVGALRSRFEVPIVLETDVNAAALAEARWGAARGASTHAYITVGTGVGVGLVVDGRPVHGAGHPEGGHLAVRLRPDDGFAGVCPWHGACVEGLISGPALQARLGRPGSDIAEDDPVWDLSGDYLGQLCAALVLVAAPQRIVIGGSVGRRASILAAARRSLVDRLNGYLPRLDDAAAAEALIARAELEDAGLMGALHLAAGAAGR